MTAQALEKIKTALQRALALAEIASDWNLDEVEIDGEMVSVDDLADEFLEALKEFGIGPSEYKST